MNKFLLLAVGNIILLAGMAIGQTVMANDVEVGDGLDLATQSEAVIYGQKLLAAIQTAKKTLQTQVDNQLADPKYRAPVVKSKEVPWEIILYLWNNNTSETDLVRVLKQGKILKPINASLYDFKLVRDNGVNSLIEVVNRPELQVLAIIHPVFTDIGTTKKPKFRLDNVVYVPYSENLKNQIIIEAGVNYLNKKISAVYDELFNLKIRSLSQPTKLLAEVINPETIKTILAIEHMDSSILLNKDPASYVAKFQATLAVNEHTSYAYAKSTASARGLVQFIPSTYASMRKLRPELTLPADFVQGMTDPYNAIKAAMALLDYNLTLLPADIKEQYSFQPAELGLYSAAMYNGGPSRVRRAINKWGEAWDDYHGSNSNSLRLETAFYIDKFRLVYNYFQQPLQLASLSQ